MSGSPRARARVDAADAPAKPTAPARAKLVTHGRSQAVRLPKEFRLPGNEAPIRKEGDCLVLEPVGPRGWPLDLWKRIDGLAERLDGEAWKRPSDRVPRPIQDERDLP